MASRAADLLLKTRADRLPDFKRILVVSPHPDDETLGCGGTLAKAAARGAEIHVLVVTDGAASHREHPTVVPSDLAKLRKKELASALGILGLGDCPLHFLDVPDGTLDKLTEGERAELESQLARSIEAASPEVVFAPGRRDGSSEHESLARLLSEAVARVARPPRFLEFPVWARWQVRPLLREWSDHTRIYTSRLNPRLRTLKERAIAAHLSQIHPLPPCTEAALPADFVRLFTASTEFFFEYSLRADRDGS